MLHTYTHQHIDNQIPRIQRIGALKLANIVNKINEQIKQRNNYKKQANKNKKEKKTEKKEDN